MRLDVCLKINIAEDARNFKYAIPNYEYEHYIGTSLSIWRP
jgi:hypothetical protein